MACTSVLGLAQLLHPLPLLPALLLTLQINQSVPLVRASSLLLNLPSALLPPLPSKCSSLFSSSPGCFLCLVQRLPDTLNDLIMFLALEKGKVGAAGRLQACHSVKRCWLL